MPAKSKKQQKFFGIVRALQKGKKVPNASKKAKKVAKTISKKSAKDFASTKTKKLPEKKKNVNESYLHELVSNAIDQFILEAEYKFSKIKQINLDDKKTFRDVVDENKGVKFGISELLIFQEKQNNFGGSGKVSFIMNLNKNEVITKLTVNNVTKKYIFKKLPNVEFKGKFNYAVFIQKMDQENKNEVSIYALSQLFNNKDQSEKINILSDFITRVNTYGI